MRTRWLVLLALVGPLMMGAIFSAQSEPGSPLATPVFHHVHQNSTDPAAAIAAFQKIYPALVKVTVGGFDGVQIPNVMSILFTRVTVPPPTQPQSAFLRHVFSVPKDRKSTRLNSSH